MIESTAHILRRASPCNIHVPRRRVAAQQFVRLGLKKCNAKFSTFDHQWDKALAAVAIVDDWSRGSPMDAFVAMRTEYETPLERTERALLDRHLERPAAAMRAWRGELGAAKCGHMICEHVQRTLRSLGGMESIGEIATTRGDRELIALVEGLSSICTKIREYFCPG
jgi:hypothetical protein